MLSNYKPRSRAGETIAQRHSNSPISTPFAYTWLKHPGTWDRSRHRNVPPKDSGTVLLVPCIRYHELATRFVVVVFFSLNSSERTCFFCSSNEKAPPHPEHTHVKKKTPLSSPRELLWMFQGLCEFGRFHLQDNKGCHVATFTAVYHIDIRPSSNQGCCYLSPFMGLLLLPACGDRARVSATDALLFSFSLSPSGSVCFSVVLPGVWRVACTVWSDGQGPRLN